jgi:hypothetical protein
VQCLRGWASKLVLSCTTCGLNKNYFTSLTLENGEYEVSLRSVYALRCIGKGHAAVEIFSAIINMPPPVANLQRYRKIVHDTVCGVAEDSMKNASAECKVVNGGEGDIGVTMDGTWIRCGHVTKFGARSVMSVDNGKVLDTQVCSKFCHACSQHSKDDKKSTEYKEMYAKHNSSCAVNFEGTSGCMEVAAALVIFSHSEERNRLRYVKYIGDGDSRAFIAIIEMKPYK